MESKVPRANAGLSVQEYVDKTIGDALEMFGSGEAPPHSRVESTVSFPKQPTWMAG